MSYNGLRNTIWAKQKFVQRRLVLACHGTQHAMAPTKAPEQTLDLKLGIPFKCVIMNLETHFGQMARAKQKICAASTRFGMPWHTPRHAMAHTKACHGTHQGPRAKLGFEAWDTFQISYNELINTLWANGTGKKKIVWRRLVLACHGTHQGMSCHPPGQAMALPKACQNTHQGKPWHPPRHGCVGKHAGQGH
jgi:hypothetical protein